jgi:ribosomal protein S6--L-glutamate ligase
MKIGVLTFRSRDPEPAVEDLRLVEAAQDLGHQAVLIPTWECSIHYNKEGEQVFWKKQPFPVLDLLIPRARFIDYSELQLHLLEVLERQMPVLNRARAVSFAKNKIKTLQLLSAAGLPMPASLVLEDASQLPAAVESLGGFPLVLKTPYGTFGEGVSLVHSSQEAQDIFDHQIFPQLIAQEFIEEAAGKDARLFVANGTVLAAMERQAQAGEFRSNIELGATATVLDPSQELKDLACKAVAALGLDYAGVDVVHSKRGPLILEVNANAGFKMLEQVSGVDIASVLISGSSQSHQ